VISEVSGVADQRRELTKDTLMFDSINNHSSTGVAAFNVEAAEPQATARKRAPMVSAVLLGRHTHESANGVAVHIWCRGNSYLARGSYNKRRFGASLGCNEKEAEARLHAVLYEIGQGTYIVPSDSKERPLGQPTVARLTIRQLADEFLVDKRQTKGEQTAIDYRSRLAPLIEFSELEKSRKRWPTAANVDREFAIEFRVQLLSRVVNRNGRAASQEKLISPNQVYNVLDCARTAFHWGKSIQIAKLPSSFVNPFTKDIVGQRPQKDPLRKSLYPLELRAQLVANMDEWQLTHLAIPLLLPLRPEDYTALLIGDVDFTSGWLNFGTRFGGRDFNKGHVSFVSPYPVDLVPFLRFLAAGRTDGPLLRARTVFEGRRTPRRVVDRDRGAGWQIEDAIRHAAPRCLATPQDQKRLVRRTIREMGGVDGDNLAEEFGNVLRKAGMEKLGRFYDLRGSVKTEMERSGVSLLMQKYLSGHTIGEITFAYTSLDPNTEMKKYFATLSPLLDAMLTRARQLGLKLPI